MAESRAFSSVFVKRKGEICVLPSVTDPGPADPNPEVCDSLQYPVVMCWNRPALFHRSDLKDSNILLQGTMRELRPNYVSKLVKFSPAAVDCLARNGQTGDAYIHGGITQGLLKI